MDYLLIAAGFAVLYLGGESLVRGAAAIARAFSISPAVIGLTLVGFGTSAPELLVAIEATSAGSAGIAVGSVLGSNVSNLMLILGAAAVLVPFPLRLGALASELVALGGATFLAWSFLSDGLITRGEGAVLVTGLVLFVLHSLRRGGTTRPLPEVETITGPAALAWVRFGLGLAALIFGADLLVRGAIGAARLWQVPDDVIGLTLVALGTSLPELATTLVATWRRERDVALGNILGSNIFNLLGILGLTALVSPIATDPGRVTVDFFWLAASLLAVVLLASARGQISRRSGFGLVAGYALFVAAVLAPAL